MKEDGKINVLHLRDSPWVDGPGRTILETGARINPVMYRYYIGAFCKRHEPRQPFIQAAIDRKLCAFRINESHSFDVTVLVQIKRLIKRESIDIIHTHEVRSDIIGLIAGRLSGVPVVSTLHGWIGNDIKGRILTRLDKSVLRFFSHVIAVSEKIKEEILHFGLQKDKVSVLHNALVIENYRPDREDMGFKKEIGINDGCHLVGNIGRFSPEKGQTDFIRAASIVLKELKNIKFVLIGKGDDETRLRELARELQITNEVIFAGYRDDMQRIYNSLDLVVQSSYTEGMPNVILESLAMEVPVIATDVGGTSEAIENNKTGVLISPGKPEKLSEKILAFIQNKDTFNEMAKKGRKYVAANFNFDERTRKLSRIYDRLVSQATNSMILV